MKNELSAYFSFQISCVIIHLLTTKSLFAHGEHIFTKENIYSAWANKIKFTCSSIKQKHIQEKNRLAFYLGLE